MSNGYRPARAEVTTAGRAARSGERGAPLTDALRVTMAAGFERVVARAIQDDVPGVELRAIKSGCIDLTSRSSSVEAVATLPYLSLVLLELARVEERSLDRAVRRFARLMQRQRVPAIVTTGRTFRIRVSDGGSLVPVDASARMSLERSISRWASLRPEPRGGGLEVWVSRRREEDTISLSVRADDGPTEKVPKGALKPDVAAAMVRVVSPSDADVFFDPFAGSGAIARARARYPHSLLVATDLDPACEGKLRGLQHTGALGPNARVGRVDARAFDQVTHILGGRKVSAVVTDPPWGLFAGPEEGVTGLYAEMLSNLERVMAPGGRLVLLTAVPSAVELGLRGSRLRSEESFGVLVNGKKASVIVLVGMNQAGEPRT